MTTPPSIDVSPPAPAEPVVLTDNCSPAPLTLLNSMGQMQVGVVVDVRLDEIDAARLKSLGICRGRRIQLVKTGDPLILRVLGTRVGLSSRLAGGITVEPCASC